MNENSWNEYRLTRRNFLGLAAFGSGLVVLGGCGGSGGGGEGGDGFLIGMSQANNAEPYREVMNDDIRNAASDIARFEIAISDAEQDNAQQVADVRNFITQQVSLLMISPNEAAPLTDVVAEAYDQDIPVIVIDRQVSGDAYTQFIGANNFEIGRRAGEYVAQELLPDGGSVAELEGLPGSTPAQERAEGFRRGIEGNSGIEIIATGTGNWLREEGQSQFAAILQAQNEIDVLYSHNDPMAEGAYIAAESVGRAGDIRFVGIDGLAIPSGGIRAVQEGRLTATFLYPTGGREAVESARRILIDDEEVPRERILETQLVTQENAAEVYQQLNPGG